MKEEFGINCIGEIDFLDIKVKVYYDPYLDGNTVQCCWRARNPDSFYTGLLYRDVNTGIITYPPEVIIPEQTPRDREIIPKFLITDQKDLNEKLKNSIDDYLDANYFRRNKSVLDKEEKEFFKDWNDDCCGNYVGFTKDIGRNTFIVSRMNTAKSGKYDLGKFPLGYNSSMAGNLGNCSMEKENLTIKMIKDILIDFPYHDQ